MVLRLQELLQAKDINNNELAKLIGWSPQRLHSRLNVDNISTDTIQSIATAIGCEPHELIETSDSYAHFYDKGEWLGIRKK